jgi:uncharacterized protein
VKAGPSVLILDRDSRSSPCCGSTRSSLATGLSEVIPSNQVRTMARRLLRLHTLRAAHALQLAAAAIAAEHEPRSLEFVCLDDRLRAAASREGFRVVPAT